MSLNAHLAQLTEQHRTLKQKIADAMAKPGTNEVEVHRLKLQKLRLKDEIAKLQSKNRH